MRADELTLAEVGRIAGAILDEVERAVVGKRDALELVLLGVLADGHVLIEDFPGLAKTLIARSFAQVLSLDFKRIQFTPDLMPSDVTGSALFSPRSSEFEFRPGPIFANLLLADEINRAPAKTQSALLEGMQERQVTVDGVGHRLPAPFIVLATQNPLEYEGTYPLPEAQLDRFLLRMAVGYPTPDQEWEVLERRLAQRQDEVTLQARAGAADLARMREAIEGVHVEPSLGRYIIDVVGATRESARVQVGASPRGSLALLKLSRCRAALRGRDFVVPEDVKAVAEPALAHRLTLRPELWVQRIRGEDVVAECLETVPTPPTREPSSR
ncbi:MAG: MoxR family ATPase [Candidatus Dormibacteraeota bacterium]|nr:MoxR family ATPase [Candidatus Dormibacteraeota bacterium]